MEWLDATSWREPLWLLVAFQPFALYLLVLLVRLSRRENYADQHLLAWSKISGRNNNLKNSRHGLFLLLAWIGFAISMAGPRTAEKVFSTDPSALTNIMVVFDVSRSMDAHDINPSRLERARVELYNFLERTQDSRIGIVLYAARPHLLSPLTADKNLLRHYISNIETSLLPTRGSKLKDALDYAARYLGKNNQQAILVISDGESTQEKIGHYEKVLSKIKEQDIVIYSLVTGTDNGAPLLSEKSGWLTFENQDVISKAKAGLLKDIALLTNGKYSSLSSSDQEWQELYDNGIARLNPAKQLRKTNADLVIWKEWYPVFLVFASLCFILAYLDTASLERRTSLSLTIGAIFIASGFIINNSFASDNYQQAYQYYLEDDFEKAEKTFSEVETFAGRLGQASAAYQAKHYSKAVILFIQATLKAQTDEQRIHALFNLANSYYQLENYQAAANIYQDVLRYQPGFQPAQTNLSYAQALIRQRKKEQAQIVVSRAGNGPRTAKPTAEMDLARGNLTLGEEADSKPYGFSGSQESLSNLPSADLSSAGLVTRDVERDEDTQWTYQFHSLGEMAAMANTTVSNERVFWQRLFEWEEGFPAPLTEPNNIPGVKPW
ncbi:MAG: VWA domain-containing protein [Gammaproteobacteria bacterium]